MKIGLIDVDGHNFPNIPLMKISAYHKAKGDAVTWYQPLFTGHCDIVYMSKVFSFTPDYEYFIDADKIIKGGSGYAISTAGGGRTLQQSSRRSVTGRNRTHLPRLQFIPGINQRYGIRIFNARLSAWLRFLPRKRKRGAALL